MPLGNPQGYRHLTALQQRPGMGPVRSAPSAGGFLPSPSGSAPMGGFRSPQSFNPSQLSGPMQNLFFALPEGTEEFFGAAPEGFNRTHQFGAKHPFFGGSFGGMF